jgi:hypothetical protein
MSVRPGRPLTGRERADGVARELRGLEGAVRRHPAVALQVAF